MPDEPLNPEELEEKAVESIIGDASLRDELTDQEAKQLIDWGVSQATEMARRAGAMASAETVEASLHDLRRLMKRINRLVGHRTAGDAEAVQKDLDRLGTLSAQLFGDAVPQAAVSQMGMFMAEQEKLSNEELVKRLMAMYAPPPGPPRELNAPPRREQLSGPKTSGFLSDGEDKSE